MSSVANRLPTVTANDGFGLVELEVTRYYLDIRFRMLQPGELARAQGFPDAYQFAGTKKEQVKQIGNAVPRIPLWRSSWNA
jgi:DNA (cytosine-5)-methyltransferase 1